MLLMNSTVTKCNKAVVKNSGTVKFVPDNYKN